LENFEFIPKEAIARIAQGYPSSELPIRLLKKLMEEGSRQYYRTFFLKIFSEISPNFLKFLLNFSEIIF
jgi:hypothetical protein